MTINYSFSNLIKIHLNVNQKVLSSINSVFQNELDSAVLVWNTHRIAHSKNSLLPSGRPSLMYELPQIYKTENYIVPVNNAVVEELKESCKFLNTPCDNSVYQLCNTIIAENVWNKSSDPADAVNLYVNLRMEILRLLR